MTTRRPGGGRKPLPTHLKLVKGTARKGRLNAREPKIKAADRTPKPPKFLSKEAKKEWKLQVDDLQQAGILTKIDRTALAAYCQAFGRWQQAEEILAGIATHDEATKGFMLKTISGNVIQNPIVGIANKAQADVMRYAAELGMTPSARSRVNATPIEEDDPAEKYFRA